MSGGTVAHALGQWGEQVVANALTQKGWRVLEHNFSCRFGEIDLIAAGAEYIIFVEVKLRKNARFSQAREAVTWEKQRKLRATAEFYLMKHPTRLQPRFDVAEVYAPQGADTKSPDIVYIQNAF